MGHQSATGLNLFFQLWAYVSPIIGAIIADQYLGKYVTILVFCVVYIVGLLILLLTSLPVSLAHGAGLVSTSVLQLKNFTDRIQGGFIAAAIIIGLGTGGIKSNIAPLIADQYKRRRMEVKTLPTGERVIIDPGVTIQRIYMVCWSKTPFPH